MSFLRRHRGALLVLLAASSLTWTLVRVWLTTYHSLQLDLDVYLLGAQHLTDGSLYHVSLSFSPHLPYTYPPFSAIAFLPLTWLPHQAAQLSWAALNVLALAGIIALSLRALRADLRGRNLVLWTLIALGPAFSLEPVWLTFNYGQINLVLTVMILADLTGHLRCGSRTLPRGILLGIAAAIKLIPLVFVAYLFVTRQTKAAWTAVWTFLACSAIAFAVAPRTSWSYWTHYATDASRVGGVWFTSNQSLRGMLDRFSHTALGAFVPTVVGLVVLIAGLAVARRAYRESSPFLGMLVAAVTGLLVSPITWAHHMVWIIPILLWLLLGDDRPRSGRPIAIVGAILFWWAPIWHVAFGGTAELHEGAGQLVLGNAFGLAAVAFLIGIAVMLHLRQRRRPLAAA